MKRIASIGLILLLSLECFYKLGVITYFQLNRDYIAEVLCINRDEPVKMCHGQCFLKQNLNVADSETQDSGTPPPETQKIDLPVFLITETDYSVAGFTDLERSNSRYLINFSPADKPKPFHPPA